MDLIRQLCRNPRVYAAYIRNLIARIEPDLHIHPRGQAYNLLVSELKRLVSDPSVLFTARLALCGESNLLRSLGVSDFLSYLDLDLVEKTVVCLALFHSRHEKAQG